MVSQQRRPYTATKEYDDIQLQLTSLTMDDLPSSLHNISFGLNFTHILDYLPNKLLARFIFRSKPPASPTVLDLETLPPPTISDFMATNDWETPLALVSKSQAAAKTKLPTADERSLLLGPLGFFTSGYMLGLFLMVSPLFDPYPSSLASCNHDT